MGVVVALLARLGIAEGTAPVDIVCVTPVCTKTVGETVANEVAMVGTVSVKQVDDVDAVPVTRLVVVTVAGVICKGVVAVSASTLVLSVTASHLIAHAIAVEAIETAISLAGRTRVLVFIAIANGWIVPYNSAA